MSAENWRNSPCINGTNVRRWYVRKYGPLPAGVFVLHHCDNRVCKNSDHIFLGNQSVNMVDCNLKGRLKPGNGFRRPQLTVENVREIRNTPEVSDTEWAARLKVGYRAIHRIRKMESWRDVA